MCERGSHANKTPFLTGFPTLLFGSAKAKMQDLLRAARREIQQRNSGGLSVQLVAEIPAEVVSRHASTKRTRVCSQEVTFWAFLTQVLSDGGSCGGAVARVQEWMRARNLPAEMLRSIQADLFGRLEQDLPGQQLWRGHRVTAVDATEAQLFRALSQRRTTHKNPRCTRLPSAIDTRSG